MADLTQELWADKLKNDDNAVLIDVRTEEEFGEGYIPNAINMNIFKGQAFVYELEALDKSKNYYVYCRSGGRSGQACEIMNQMGFENAYNLMGGFSEWTGEKTI
ncbi:rhodanese-like domain-containing protein [Bizionia paragorgiae]|jgi:rhodanese-related sulfurtransferase|uniref:Rhodanese-related sulfurtransferase n=1 Tax=Bizionia paragorgiae TaxID=283786 RepID=A0A1H3ZBL0_BIZPA|nr:rhodanese-like domain-containing protein [Bizionia paragorgiae]MDX1271948.1 rhodanese-like domain-containing protein [Bizionia paragorgiae]SEA21047.1 Rhodanese-related sulfurtransferase [Bizionia paragorgiae]